jgi:hypothetical protein
MPKLRKRQDICAGIEAEEAETQGEKPKEPSEYKQVDLGVARKDVHKMVRASIVKIAQTLIQSAADGNLPAAKYLFEMAGVYPIRENGSSEIEEGSLAEMLLKHLGIPIEPVEGEPLNSGNPFPAPAPIGGDPLESSAAEIP